MLARDTHMEELLQRLHCHELISTEARDTCVQTLPVLLVNLSHEFVLKGNLGNGCRLNTLTLNVAEDLL